jgi:hypothetical protein
MWTAASPVVAARRRFCLAHGHFADGEVAAPGDGGAVSLTLEL